ncbi:hypothetical protein [Actinomadura meridiana]
MRVLGIFTSITTGSITTGSITTVSITTGSHLTAGRPPGGGRGR